MYRLGVDVGGTFTDLVLIGQGRLITAKVLSTAQDQSAGVLKAFEHTGLPSQDVDVFAHGTTLATNALLENKGASVVFVTTEGFRDLLAIGRQNRPSLYDLKQPKPALLASREHTLTIQERIGPQGVLKPLLNSEVHRLIDQLRPWVEAGMIEAVAVGFLFAFRDPSHEEKLGKALAKAFPEIHLSLSSQISPEFREYERFSTTVVNAYLSPKVSRYLANLAERSKSAGLPKPLVMQSSGGINTLEYSRQRGASLLLSGPAGGVRGALEIAKKSGYEHVLTFDMGGTSTDVAQIYQGQVQTRHQATVGGYPVRLPQIDIHTVSAGGGSIAWADAGGALRVGPQSAGSSPGPVCYGQGGTEPTVTDANLFLGYLEAGAILGGDVVLQRDLSVAAITALGQKLKLTPEETAVGIRTVANIQMVQALRVVSVERGFDPKDFALLAFGGAGPMHGCDLAESLGMTTLLIPAAGGVLSALGMALSDLQRDYSRPILTLLQAMPEEQWPILLEPLVQQAQKDLSSPKLFPTADLRYRGQSFELNLPLEPGLERAFHQAHQQRYGWSDATALIEWVQLRLSALEITPPLAWEEESGESDEPIARVHTWFNAKGFQEVLLYDRGKLGPGAQLAGPAIMSMREATVVINPGWGGTIDSQGTLILHYS
jgi:N-methylhydantoinase A